MRWLRSRGRRCFRWMLADADGPWWYAVAWAFFDSKCGEVFGKVIGDWLRVFFVLGNLYRFCM